MHLSYINFNVKNIKGIKLKMGGGVDEEMNNQSWEES